MFDVVFVCGKFRQINLNVSIYERTLSSNDSGKINKEFDVENAN